MKKTLLLILASGLLLACSGDSKDDAADTGLDVDVVTAEDADAEAAKSMDTAENANAEIDKMTKEFDG